MIRRHFICTQSLYCFKLCSVTHLMHPWRPTPAHKNYAPKHRTCDIRTFVQTLCDFSSFRCRYEELNIPIVANICPSCVWPQVTLHAWFRRQEMFQLFAQNVHGYSCTTSARVFILRQPTSSQRLGARTEANTINFLYIVAAFIRCGAFVRSSFLLFNETSVVTLFQHLVAAGFWIVLCYLFSYLLDWIKSPCWLYAGVAGRESRVQYFVVTILYSYWKCDCFSLRKSFRKFYVKCVTFWLKNSYQVCHPFSWPTLLNWYLG